MDLENREKEGEKDYEDKKTYCCGFNGTYATGTYVLLAISKLQL